MIQKPEKVKPANRRIAKTGSIFGSLNCFTLVVPSGTSNTVNFLENNKTLQIEDIRWRKPSI